MASLKDIRRRIGSVKNTQQITKAMKMVAAAKLRRSQELISGARPFAEKIEELSGRLLSEIALQNTDEEAGLEKLHPLLKQETPASEFLPGQKPKMALLVISSDKGLCGAYNTNVIKRTLSVVEDLKVKYDIEFFYVGRKAYELLRKRGMDGKIFRDFWTGVFTNTVSARVADELILKFIEGEFERVDVVFTEFRSALSQTVQSKTILPLHGAQIEEKAESAEESQNEFVFKPNKQELLDSLLPAQVKTQFFRCFADSLASEFGSRMTSMDNATRNAKEMIGKLTLEANRVRQASITNELMEIVSGAEALKG